jgi:hypothetical protein
VLTGPGDVDVAGGHVEYCEKNEVAEEEVLVVVDVFVMDYTESEAAEEDDDGN